MNADSSYGRLYGIQLYLTDAILVMCITWPSGKPYCCHLQSAAGWLGVLTNVNCKLDITRFFFKLANDATQSSEDMVSNNTICK